MVSLEKKAREREIGLINARRCGCEENDRSADGRTLLRAYPVGRNKLISSTPALDYGGFEPWIFQVGVIHDDDLKARRKFFSRQGDQLEELQYGRLVFVFQRIYRAFSVSVWWVMRLGWLVENEKAGNWTLFLVEPLV